MCKGFMPILLWDRNKKSEKAFELLHNAGIFYGIVQVKGTAGPKLIIGLGSDSMLYGLEEIKNWLQSKKAQGQSLLPFYFIYKLDTMLKAAMKLSSNKRTIFIAIAGLLLVLSLNFFQKEVKGFFYSFSSPIQKSFWSAGDGISDFFESIFNVNNLKKENEELNLKMQETLALQNSVNELEKENKLLREALELGLEKEFRLELAEVIGKDSDKDAILIDKGSEDGISKGLFIITSQKVLIGKIEEVFQKYSKVLLISDESSQIQAKVSGSNADGLLKGLGSGRVLLDLVPMEAEIKSGDTAVSGDFLIGLVSEVKKTDASPFQQAEISSFLKISDLDKLFIVLEF